MAKYIVKYKFNGKERSVKRIADNAEEAIDRLVNQYSWSWKLSMVDADTRGSEWCSGLVDVDGGINYDMRVVSYMEKQTEIKGDKNMKWEIDGEQVIAFVNDHAYYCTNNHGEGIFYVDQIKNTRSQLTGTCQFSVYGLKPESKKSKLRKYINRKEI